MSNSYLRLHLVVFIWGFTAILGDLISQEAIPLVWNRMLLAILALLLYLFFKKKLVLVDRKSMLIFFGAGLIIAVHWIAFFHAIKISNVSVTLACLSSGAFFTALLEPIFFKKRLVVYEVFMGLLVIAGIATIFAVETQYKWGIITALSSAFLSALFSVINGLLAKRHNASIITLYELTGGWLGITVFLLSSGGMQLSLLPATSTDWVYLFVLGVVCTAYPFLESVNVMKILNPFTVMLTINLEPVYGILMAYFILGDKEKMTSGFYIGAVIILLTVFANALIKSKNLKFMRGVNKV